MSRGLQRVLPCLACAEPGRSRCAARGARGIAGRNTHGHRGTRPARDGAGSARRITRPLCIARRKRSLRGVRSTSARVSHPGACAALPKGSDTQSRRFASAWPEAKSPPASSISGVRCHQPVDTLDAERIDVLLGVVNARYCAALGVDPHARHAISEIAAECDVLAFKEIDDDSATAGSTRDDNAG